MCHAIRIAMGERTLDRVLEMAAIHSDHILELLVECSTPEEGRSDVELDFITEAGGFDTEVRINDPSNICWISKEDIACGVRNLRVPAYKVACHEIANPAEEATIPITMSKNSTKKAEDIGTKVACIGRQTEAKAKTVKAAKKTMSGLDAAASVLLSERRAMSAKELVAAIKERGLAPNLGGKTPHATLYAAMITEISKRGAESRFKRGSVKGTFQANA